VFRSINLTTKSVLIVAVAIALTAGATGFAAARAMWAQIEQKQRQDGEQSIRTLALVFGARVAGAKVAMDGGRVAKAEAPALNAFSDMGVVDEAVAYAGGNATIFAFEPAKDAFVRRTTTVKKENGERAVGTSLAADHPAQAVVRRGETYAGPATLFGRQFYTVYQPTFDRAGAVNGILYVGIPIEEYVGLYEDGVRMVALIGAGIALLLCLVAGAIAARTFRPLQAIAGRVEGLARGDLESPIDHRERGDEIGAVARALEVLRGTSRRARELEQGTQATAEAESRRRTELDGAIREFRDRAGQLLGSLTSSTQGLRGRARDMSAVSDETRGAVEAASMGSREASSNVQTVACAAEELSASIAEIASQLDRAAGLAGTAVAEAASTDVHVGGLAEAAQRIGEVVGLIQAIADQTNLLALNATIEAARAGEAGKGFAVVASEVKTLATQTGKATQEISSHIATVQSSTNGAVDAIRRITARMREINETTAGIAAAVVEQGSATEEISRNVAEAARGTQEMAQGLDTVTSTAQRTASAAATVTDAAEHVDGVAAGLEQEIERFLKRVAA
jgi:methyl-accepting chemotaxis protein